MREEGDVCVEKDVDFGGEGVAVSGCVDAADVGSIDCYHDGLFV